MPPTHEREAALFALAAEKPTDERDAFLQAVCGDDAALRERLILLLAAHEHPDASLDGGMGIPTVKLTQPVNIGTRAPDESVGQVLGRYKLLERVGEGGCGIVYVAEQTHPVRRRVALKVIKLGMDTKEVIARFEAERQALAMMDHPNIAKVLDAGATETGRPYFVMELVRGIRITDYCDQENLSTHQRLDLFTKVCHAIQHAHQKGIIHRDIKPSNILVTLHDGVAVPKVIDFGIAKATEGRLTEATIYTQLHQFIGTPAYMSPEQAEMSGLDIDTRSDIYSLGVLLYELLAGSTPFDPKELMASGIDAMRKTIREKEPIRPSTRLATLPYEVLTTTARRRSTDLSKLMHQLKGDLDWIVMKCLEKDRSRRYETANGLAADIKRHLGDEPVAARPPSAFYRLHKSYRRNRVAFIAAGCVLVVMGTAMCSIWASARRESVARVHESIQRNLAEQRQQEAQQALKIAQSEQQRADAQSHKASENEQLSRRLLYGSDMNLAHQSLKSNNLGRARRLLDRHRPKPGGEDLRGWEWRYLWDLTRSAALTTLTKRSTRAFSVSFSPDGTRLAAGWFNGKVDLWDVPARQLIKTLAPESKFPAAEVAFSPVANILAATADDGKVMLHNLDSGHDMVISDPSGGNLSVRDLSYSQDGSKLIIFNETSHAATALVMNSQTGALEYQRRVVFESAVFFGAARLSPDNRFLYVSHSRQRAERSKIECVDITTDQKIWETEDQRDSGISTLAISPDGKVLASASGYSGTSICLWDARIGTPLRQLEGHTAWVSRLAFSKDGTMLFSSGSDQTIRIWDTKTWSETRVLCGHTDEVHTQAYSDVTGLIASGSRDGELKLWRADRESVRDGYLRFPPEMKRGYEVHSLDGSSIAINQGNSCTILDVKRGFRTIAVPDSETKGRLLKISGKYFIRWSENEEVRVQRWSDGKLNSQGKIKINEGMPSVVALSESGQLLAWSHRTSPNKIYLAGLAEPNRRRELALESADPPTALTFGGDGRFLAASLKAGLTRIWEVESGRIILNLKQAATASAFAAGGAKFVTICEKGNDHEIAFFDLEHPGSEPRRHSALTRAEVIAVSKDETMVATTCDAGLVRLFDAASCDLIATLHGHLTGAHGIAFSPDGRRLVSGGSGGETVKLWDVSTRQELLTLNNGVRSVMFKAKWSADGDTIMAGPPWQAWRARSWDDIAIAEGKQDPAREKP